jgi:PAS domain S-box-containing protein
MLPSVRTFSIVRLRTCRPRDFDYRHWIRQTHSFGLGSQFETVSTPSVAVWGSSKKLRPGARRRAPGGALVRPLSSVVNIITLPVSIEKSDAPVSPRRRVVQASQIQVVASNQPDCKARWIQKSHPVVTITRLRPPVVEGPPADIPGFFRRKCESMNTSEARHSQDLLSLVKGVSPAVPEQLLLLDAHLSVQLANKSLYATFHVTAGQIVGKKLADLGYGQWNNPALLTCLSELPKLDAESDDLEMQHVFPALAGKTMVVSVRRLAGDDARGGMILLSLRECVGQKRVEPEIAELLVRFSHDAPQHWDGVIVTDTESRITFMNPAAEKLTGWSQSEALQRNLNEIINIVSERSSQVVENTLARAIREGAVVGLANHTILIAQDGCEWPIDDTGQLVGVVLVFRDISNTRKEEQDLEISEVRYRPLFESAHDGILILDSVTTKVLEVNPFMADLLGYPREHFWGRALREIGVFKDAEVSKKAMAILQRLGRIRFEDLPLQHRDGRHIPVEFVNNVHQEGRQNVIQCNIRDLTGRKYLADDLAKARQEAETANLSKSEFPANMSHEIRTPMGAILGFTEMLRINTPEECAQIGCVRIIQQNSLHLLELFNEILGLSKVEAGRR